VGEVFGTHHRKTEDRREGGVCGTHHRKKSRWVPKTPPTLRSVSSVTLWLGTHWSYFSTEGQARAMARMNSGKVDRPARPTQRLRPEAREEPAVIRDPLPPGQPRLVQAASCFRPDAAR